MRQVEAMELPRLSAVTPTVPSTLEEMLDLEAIKVLKVRYWQALDTHAWGALEACCTADAKITMDREPFASLEEFMELNVSGMQGHRSLHQAWGLPAIELCGDDEARGYWYMTATVRGEQFNHSERAVYEDEYRKVNGTWLIKSLDLTHVIVIKEDGTVPYQPGHAFAEKSNSLGADRR